MTPSSSSRGMTVRGSLLLDSLRGALLSTTPEAPRAAAACEQQSCAAAKKRVAVLQGEIDCLSCKLDGHQHALRDYEETVATLRAALAAANAQLEAAGLTPVATTLQGADYSTPPPTAAPLLGRAAPDIKQLHNRRGSTSGTGSSSDASVSTHFGASTRLQLSPGGGPALCLLPQLSRAASAVPWFEAGPETPLGNDASGGPAPGSASSASVAAGRQLVLSASLDDLSLTAAAAAGLGRDRASAAGAEAQTQEAEEVEASSEAITWWRPPSTAARYSSSSARAGSDSDELRLHQLQGDGDDEEDSVVLTGSAAPSPSAAVVVATEPACKPPQRQDQAPGSSRLTAGDRRGGRKGIGRGSLTSGAGLFGLHVHGLPAGLTCSCDNPLFAADAADWE